MNYVPNMNRRAFVVSTAAAGGGLALGFPFGVDTAAADSSPDADADSHGRRSDCVTDPDPHTDARSHHAAKLHAAADRDPDADRHHRLSAPGQRAKSNLLPFSGVIDERCSSMSTEGGRPVSITTAIRSERRSPPMRTQSRRNVNAIGRTRFHT